MERKRVRFSFEALEYKAAQDWLNRLGAEGWRLAENCRGLFGFRRDGRAAVSYAVDLDRNLPPVEQEAYLRLCADAGWDFVTAQAGMLIFASAPGARPVPLQTDPELERVALRGYLARRWALALLAAAWPALLLWMNWAASPGLREWLPRTAGFRLLAGAVVLTWALTALKIALETAYYLRCRREVRAGRGIPAGTRGTRRLEQLVVCASLALAAAGCALLLWQLCAAGIPR